MFLAIDYLSLNVIALDVSPLYFGNGKTKVQDESESCLLKNGGNALGIMKTAAVKGIIPAGNKVSELRSNLLRLITETSIVLDERFGAAGLDAVTEIFRRLGEEDARTMKGRLGLGDSLKDSLDAWLVIGHIMGSKMKSDWISDTRVEVSHSYCPQYEEFMRHGKLYCASACLPYVAAVGENIGTGVTMDVVKAADENAPCVKALLVPTKDSE
jgi:hypothetical protein